MSLVFLKNDDNSRDDDPATVDNHLLPYRWSNYFTNPIRVPRNAQVGYIKSSFQQKSTGYVDDAIIYVKTGMPELNPTIPLRLEGGPVSDWKQVFAELGRLCNQYASDGNYTSNYKSTLVYEGVNQGEFNLGWNWFITSQNKSQIRLEPRVFEDVANQGFNSGGYNGAAGLNTLNLDHIDYDIIAINSPYYNAVGGVDGVGFAGPAQRINFDTTSNFVPVGFTGFYDCGWGGFRTQSGSAGVGSGNPIFAKYTYDRQLTPGGKGAYGMVMSNTGIKQNTSQITPLSQGGGHQFNGSGYVIKTFRRFPLAFAQNDYPNPNGVAANAGRFNGIWTHFGIQSLNLIDNMPGALNITDSREKFVERMDLNSSSDPNVATGAVPRFLIGCDIEVENGQNPGEVYPVMKVRVLDPDGAIGQSSYITVATLDLTAAAAAAGVHLNSADPVPDANGQLSVRFRWTSPYCMAVEYCFRYRQEIDVPFAPGTVGADPTTDWVLLYDMNNDPAVAPQILMPGWYGDLTLVEYPVGNLEQTCRKGFFDYRKSYRIKENQVLGEDLLMTPLDDTAFYEGFSLDELKTYCINTGAGAPTTTPILNGLTAESFDGQGYSQKEVSIVMNPIKSAAGLLENLTLNGDEYFFLNNPDTFLGDILGYDTSPTDLNNNIIGPPASNSFICIRGVRKFFLSI